MKKAYLDDDVVSVIAKDDNGAESAALDLLLAAYRERKVDLVTSAVTLKELESYQGPQRPAIKRIFGFLKEVPNACVPMIQNNPLYDDLLKRGLEVIDAWHVFVAVKNGCQAFLTCDRLIHHYSASIRQICGLVVQKPSDFVASEGW
jgi:predicted nucleic acid-binding protein